MSIKILDAVKNNLYSQLILYLKYGYNFKVKTSEGYNALMVALTISNSEKRYKMFEFLLRNDCIDVLDTDDKGRNIFFWTVIRQCIPELDFLMRNYHTEIDWSYKDQSGKTLLHNAVLSNNTVIMSILLKYCMKYRINVDIPDRKDKITPYLLACKLNFMKIADLLVKFGQASKNQSDEYSHFNANEWKEEGKMQKFKAYIEKKQDEMKMAKLKGQINKFNELNNLSKTLNLEIQRNPEIVPIFAKAIIDMEQQDADSNHFNITFDDQLNLSEFEDIQFKNKNTNSFQKISNSNLNMNSFLKDTMESIINRRKSIGEVNSLLEMTNGQTADHFIGSKSDDEFNKMIKQPNITTTSSSNIGLEPQNTSFNELTHIFQIAACQQSNNYRSPAKNLLPLKRESIKKKQKIKTGFSTLAIIREESRLRTNSKKTNNLNKKFFKQSKSMPNLQLHNKMRLKTNL